MSNSNDPGHGNSVASWTTVIIIMAAFALGTWFVWDHNIAGAYASAGLVVVGLLAGWVLKKLGYGVGGSKTKSH
jgi:carbon starvation protein CstA